jgi:hypothetical protein
MEAVFCKRDPKPEACLRAEYDFDPELPNVSSSLFDVKQTKIGDQAGLGTFTTVDILKDSLMSAETNVQAVRFMPTTVDLIQQLAEQDFGKNLDILKRYMKEYGFFSQKFVSDV